MAIFQFINILVFSFILFGIITEANEIPSYTQLLKESLNDFEYTKSIYHYLHKHPELGFQEFETSEFIQNTLAENNISFVSGLAVDSNNPIYPGTGVMATIGTGKSPCVAIRADIDALPLQEMVDIPHKSTHDGCMHACGHDSHATMLLAAGKLLKQHEDQLNGTVKLLFQPAEEGGGGGMMMANEGLLYQEPAAEAIFALHVDPREKTGTLTSCNGIATSAVDDFHITVYGKGGHASAQMDVKNPIYAGADIIKMLPLIQAHKTSFDENHIALITVSFFNSPSDGYNVVPDYIEIGGTIRASTKEKLDFLKQKIKDSAETISQAYGCTATYEPKNQEYPPLYNDPNLFNFVEEIAKETSTDGKLTKGKFRLGGEDFSFLTQQVSGIMIKIGSGSGGEKEGHLPTNYVGHNSHFLIDEDVLPLGAALEATLAFKQLKILNKNNVYIENQDNKSLKDEL